jgi:predicted Zn-dependent protease
MMGVSAAADFNAYAPYFSNSMQSFRELTDASKINKKPERIRIKTVSQSMTLDAALRNFRMPANRLEELSILNGMKLTDNIPAGTMIKVISE